MWILAVSLKLQYDWPGARISDFWWLPPCIQLEIETPAGSANSRIIAGPEALISPSVLNGLIA